MRRGIEYTCEALPNTWPDSRASIIRE